MKLEERSTILLNYNNLEYVEVWDEYGEPMYDELTGDIILDTYGRSFGGLYNYSENRWVGPRLARITSHPQGYFLDTVYQKPGDYYATSPSYLTGFSDKQFNEILPIKFTNCKAIDDVLLVENGSNVGVFDFSGNEILPTSKDLWGLKYVDGFFFRPELEQLDEWGDVLYDEEGNPSMIPQILKDKEGTDLEGVPMGSELLNGGMLRVGSSYGEVGFFNLKTNSYAVEKVLTVKNYRLPGQRYWVLMENKKWQLHQLTTNWKPVNAKQYDEVVDVDVTDRFFVEKGEKTGVVNAMGKEILPARYILGEQLYDDYNRPRYKLHLNNKVGVYDLVKNEVIIPIEYNEILWFEDAAVVKKDGKSGVLGFNPPGDKAVTWMFKPQFDGDLEFAEKFYYLREKGNTGVLGLTGDLLVPTNFKAVRPIDEYYYSLYEKNIQDREYNYFLVSEKSTEGEKQGVYKAQEGLVIQTEYDRLGPTTDPLLIYLNIKTTEADYVGGFKWGLFDLATQNVRVPVEYQLIKPMGGASNQYWAKKEGMYGILDLDGNTLLEPTYDEVSNSKMWYRNKGYWKVYKGDKVGVFSESTNELVIPCEYEEVIWKSNFHHLVLKRNDQFAIVEKKGFTQKGGFNYSSIEVMENRRNDLFVLVAEHDMSLLPDQVEAQIVFNGFKKSVN